MYVQRGKRLTVAAVEKILREKYDSYLKGCNDQEIKQYAREFVNLNNALLAGDDVWALCEREPQNLDRGKHWFQIQYCIRVQQITPDGKGKRWVMQRTVFWAPPFMDKCKIRWLRAYGFSSGAIGMSRMLDATDGIFSMLRNMGGCYAQVSN